MNCAVTFDQKSFSVLKISAYILQSKKNLSKEQIAWVSEHVRHLSNKTTNEQIATFLAYANQNSIGKFALLFNRDLDHAVENKDQYLLHSLIMGPKEMFIELYTNKKLLEVQKKVLFAKVAMEITLISTVLENTEIASKLESLLSKNDGCLLEERDFRELSMTLGNNEIVTMSGIFKACQDICFHDAEIQYAKIGDIEWMNEKEFPENLSCFDILELVEFLYCINNGEKVINPHTNEPFQALTIISLNEKLSKEILLYERYREILKEEK